MADDLVEVTIDGRPVQMPRGTRVVEAARALGIEIPVYCYHPKMKPVGACRVCAVEVEGQRKPIMMACTTEVMPNMVVHTRSEAATAAREGIIEYLLINHPLDCPVCDRGGECDLQNFTLRYGPSNTRFVEAKRHFPKSKQVGANVILDRERCIMCQRCVRFCSEIAIEEGLVIVERGNRSEIGTFEGRSYDSVFSGNTIELCPVGALTSKSYRFKARPWEQQHYAGVCNRCSVGCNLTVDVRFDEVVRFRSRMNDDIDDGWLCDRGRYGHDHIHAPERLSTPMVRNAEGVLEATSWEVALQAAAEGLKSADTDKLGVLLGSQLSVEDGHAFLRLARGVLKTGGIAHAFGHEAVLTAGADRVATGQVKGCDDAEVILCLGSHPLATHPVIDLRIKKGLRRAAHLVSLQEAPVMEGLADFAAYGKPSELWTRLLEAIDALPEEGPKGLKIPKPRPWEAGGQTSTDWDELVSCFRHKDKILILVAGDLKAQGLDTVAQDLCRRGWSTAPHGLLHLRTEANALGLDLVGCQPAMGPAGLALSETGAYRAGFASFHEGVGLSFQDAAKSGLKAMLSVGCDPMSLDGAKKPAFLVACASLPDATTEKADVILPLSTWVEGHGVFVSTDGTVQLSRQAVLPVGESQPAWTIASALIKVITGEEAPYRTARQVFSEVGKMNPAFYGYSYDSFETKSEMHWSYPQQADMGMPRPDLSAIPVPQVDAPPWMPVAHTGSRVERVARLAHGETPPAAIGQDDPRRIAAILGLAQGYTRHHDVVASSLERKVWLAPLRLTPTSGAQPPGPTPAKRHTRLGMGPRVVEAVPQLPPTLETSESNEEREIPTLPLADPAKSTPALSSKESTENVKDVQAPAAEKSAEATQSAEAAEKPGESTKDAHTPAGEKSAEVTQSAEVIDKPAESTKDVHARADEKSAEVTKGTEVADKPVAGAQLAQDEKVEERSSTSASAIAEDPAEQATSVSVAADHQEKIDPQVSAESKDENSSKADTRRAGKSPGKKGKSSSKGSKPRGKG